MSAETCHEDFTGNTALDLRCENPQGFKVNPATPVPYGYVRSMTICETAFDADLKVKNADGGEEPVVGVVIDYRWTGQNVDPFLLDFQVSTANMQSALALLTKMDKEDAEIEFELFKFDNRDGVQKYFPARVTKSPLKGVLKKQMLADGATRCLKIDETPNHAVTQPENFRMTVVVEVQGKQDMGIATSEGANEVLPIGMDS